MHDMRQVPDQTPSLTAAASGSPVRVGAVLFAGFELLDAYGPLEMFGLLEQRAKATVVAEHKGPVESSCGVSGFADAALADSRGFDILLIPGGIGIRKELNNRDFVADLRRLAQESKIVGTICTGSVLLAKTGLLSGMRATTNKRAFRAITAMAPEVNWQAEARWVEDGKYFTASGVSAGLDMSLALIGRVFGRDEALRIAARAEYEWHQESSRDPFSKLSAT